MGKVSARTALAGADAATTDLVDVVDVSATTAGSKKMTFAELLNAICNASINSTAMTGSGAHASQDFLLYSDNGVAKSITMAELQAAIIALASALAGASAHATQDHVLYSDNGVSKKMLVTELQIAMATLATAITTGFHATQDTLLYDDNGAAKKITIPDLATAICQLVTTTLAGSGVVPGTDSLIISDGGPTSGVAKSITITELMTALALAGYTLADIPEYADQAAAATGLSGTGKLWRQTTTGLLGITIT